MLKNKSIFVLPKPLKWRHLYLYTLYTNLHRYSFKMYNSPTEKKNITPYLKCSNSFRDVNFYCLLVLILQDWCGWWVFFFFFVFRFFINFNPFVLYILEYILCSRIRKCVYGTLNSVKYWSKNVYNGCTFATSRKELQW